MSVIVVTGSSRGIGAKLCGMAAEKGPTVCVNYTSSREEAERVVADIEQAGGSAIAVQANVAVEAGVENLFAIVDENWVESRVQ